jgi:DNA-binding GntR family transcriptional regulator
VSAVDEVLDGAPDMGVDSPHPAHVRIVQWLTSVIGSGGLVPGDKLPREETLAAALGVQTLIHI